MEEPWTTPSRDTSEQTRSRRKPGGSGSPSLKRVSLVVAGGAFLDGYDMLIMNAALLTLVPSLNLTDAQTGLVTSLPFIGIVLGALVAGPLCDRFGRRRIFLIDIALFFFVALLLGVAQDYWQLAVLRFVLGFTVGMDMPAGASMLAEYAPKGRVGRLTAMMASIWGVGGLVAAITGFLLYHFTGPDSWRWMFLSGAIPALIIAIARHNLPETARYKASAQRQQAAGSGPATSLRSSIAEIVRTPRYRKPVIFFSLYFLIEAFIGGAPATYTALIFNNIVDTSGSNALLLNAFISTLGVGGNLLAQFVILDRFGRKPLTIFLCLLVAAGSLATAFLQNATLTLVLAFTVANVAIHVAPVAFWPWSTEQLPTRIRATGQSIGSACGKGGHFISLNVFTVGTIASVGWMPYFSLIAVAFALLAGFVLIWGVETRSANLDALDSVDARESSAP